MTTSIVVGYTATETGSDALALGVRLARATRRHLHVLLVLPGHGDASAGAAQESPIAGQARQWLDDAEAMIPAGIGHTAHVRVHDSFAEGLVLAGEELDAALIVVGAANGATIGLHRMGSVAQALLHSSPIPVALAPAGFAHSVDVQAPIPRITAAIGNRPGADALLEAAVALSAATGATLRLISLVAFDVPRGFDAQAIRLVSAAHGDDVLARAEMELPKGVRAELERAPGDTVEEAVARLAWLPGELILVGSSRLAQPRRLFLGSTAAKMLDVIPVPMIVVPRTRLDDSADSGS
ncbi:Universal stress protein family protein [Microbacterium sp. 8M]|jgi:nucleotide-binding universal stress UspA family protein|uniref:universal stress protein n=1 Tax=Microbacterium sp. 8M TaxID=2653153 RepID=UPI0012F44D9E|nr:universal stress protein [Microbacterium sp. 8M]VXB25221.1 Universal stress protein family protein [Microbacterium sp. 8M]